MDGSVPVHIPLGQARPRPPEYGHFHVQPELFYQLSGRTVFGFPSDEFVLEEGMLLLVPPLVTHNEWVEAIGGRAFQNFVANAGRGGCQIHLAEEGSNHHPMVSLIRRSESARAPVVAAYLSEAISATERAAADRGRLWASSCGDFEWLQSTSESLVRSLVSAALCEIELAILSSGLPSLTASNGPKGKPLPRLVTECQTRALSALSDTELSVPRLAEWLRCSPDYLSHIYKAHAEESLISFIVRNRVERGRELLQESPLSVKEVSWACGFSQESYFIRKFKQQYGETPGEFKKSSRLA